MSPKQFLKAAGILLVVVAVLGFIGVLGPTSQRSIFGASWWFDNVENWAHLVVGVVALVAHRSFSSSSQKTLALVVGVVAVLVGLYGIFNQRFLSANLENPMDTLLHLAVGAWAFWVYSE